MLKFFKKVFGSGQAEENANGSGYTPQFAPAQNHTNVADPAPAGYRQPSAVAAPPSAPAQQSYAETGGVRISLDAILAVLPVELKTRIQQPSVRGMFITLPLGRVVAQLAAGAVRMSFGELRASAPNVFSPQADRDSLQIALPLNEVLPQINPAFLPRRQAQRQVSVPDDVRGPFGNDGFGVTFADTRTITGTQVNASSEAAPEPEPEPPVAAAPPPPPPVAPRPVQPPRPAPLAPPARSIQPAQAATPPPTFSPKPAPMPPITPKPPVPMAPKPAPAVPQPTALRPQAPIAPKPAPIPPQAPAMRPPMPPMAPQPPAAKTNAPTPPLPIRNPFAPTPTPPAPTATPAASPPVRPAFPTARGVGATPPAPTAPHTGSNGNGNGRVPPPMPEEFNVFQKAPQVEQTPPAPAAPIAMVPQQPIKMAPQQPSISRAPQPAPVNTPQAPAGNGSEHCLDVPLAAVTETWPEVLLGEIEQLHLSGVTLSLPLRVIEPSLKQGKIAFSWKVLRSWIRPAVVQTVSAQDGMMLELPLKVIAPLFFTRQKQVKDAGRQKVNLDENIPNLFFGFPQPDASAEEPAPQETSHEEPADFIPSAPQKTPGVADTNFYVWGDKSDAPQVDETEFKKKSAAAGTEFMSRYATPNEIVSRAGALDGVAGALVALPDGLMVASKLSADLNGDTLAAFLPHIFGKVSQCTKELRMGELNNLHFTVGNVPWKIFRVNAIFFAVFGRAGQPLPTAQLAALAAELDRKK